MTGAPQIVGPSSFQGLVPPRMIRSGIRGCGRSPPGSAPGPRSGWH